VCRGLVGPAHTAELNRDVWISGHTAWSFCFLRIIWKELESMRLCAVLVKPE